MTALDPYLPGLTDVRSRVTRGRVAKALVARAVRDLPVRVRYHGGEVLGGGDATSPGYIVGWRLTRRSVWVRGTWPASGELR